MGKNSNSVFVCQQCGNEFSKWIGQCSYCREWNSVVEVKTARLKKAGRRSQKKIQGKVKPVKVSEVSSQQIARFSTGMEELDRVFGSTRHNKYNEKSTSGIVPGSAVLLSGDPGIGKSTILSQLALNLLSLDKNTQILYVCGEESPEQVKMRFERLGRSDQISNTNDQKSSHVINNILLLPETRVEAVVEEIVKGNYQLVIIDSIQTMVSEDLSGIAGSVGQVRESGLQIVQVLKETNSAGIIVGHVTKDGSVAGPKTLEHMVDTVLRIEGDSAYGLRVVRAIKNRFGTTDEVGIFKMMEQGLQQVINPAETFLAERRAGEPGSAVAATLEGTRVLLLEIQALVVQSNLSIPRRVVNGISLSRVQMIIAVLQKYLNLRIGEMDLFINVAGGVQIDDPGVDLAVAMAIISNLKKKGLPEKMVCCGELGLLGEIRKAIAEEKRLTAAKKLGFNKLVSASNYKHVRDVAKLV